MKQKVIKQSIIFFIFLLGFNLNIQSQAYEWPDELYFDQFEMRDLSSWNIIEAKWEDGCSTTLVNTPRVSGNQALRIYISDNQGLEVSGGYVTRNFEPIHAEIELPTVYIRCYFQLGDDFDFAGDEFVNIMTAHRSAHGGLADIWLVKNNNDIHLKIRDSETLSSTVINRSQWYCLEIMYQNGTGTGEIELFLNGTSELHATGLDKPELCTGARIGANYWNCPAVKGTIYFDDFVADEQYIGPADESVTLIYPDFRSRVGAPVYAILTGDESTDRFEAVLTSTSGLNRIVYQENPVEGGRINFKIDLSGLDASTYTLTGRLIDSNGTEKASDTYTFVRNYTDDHFYSIDSDNNIIYKGAKFFPVISFGRHITTLREWAEKSRINIAGGVSWNGSGIDYYRQYLDTVEAAGLSCIGPMHDTRFDGEGEPKWTINDIEEYILTLRDHPANACWMWREEPDNWGYDAQSQKDWWDKGKELDPSRPTEILFMAFQYFYNDQNFLTWSGGTSAGLRMKLKTYHWPYLTGDIYSADWYPIEHPERPYTLFSQAIDRAYMWNMDLIPVFPNVQSCDVTHGDADVEPTVQELKNMCWLAIVHKAKGIHWYPWAPTPEINYEYMSEFVENVTELTEVILGDEPTRNVEYSTSDNVRVDIMVKEYLDETWIIAVNTSRTRATQVTFDVESLMNRSKIEVFKEDSIVSGNGSFRDVFMPMDVHIYKITDEYIPVDPDTELEIDNIYPNPFSTSTTISFSTPESGVFNIGIYSILGQKIKHIFNGELPAGHSEFYWNGNSDSGGRVSKGTYIIKVFSGRKNIIGKIVSLK